MTEAVGKRPQYEVFADEYLEHAQAGLFTHTTTDPPAWACSAMSQAQRSWTRRAGQGSTPAS